MQMGGALGSAIGLGLRVSPRERRILMVAGVAAGMAAVFRTPLGAALLAAEILYRDDFEAEALIPAIMASVIAYSVVISIFGESTLFARAPRYLFIPKHLPLYALLAILIAAVASMFLAALRGVQRLSARLPLPLWARPAAGGLALGMLRGAAHHSGRWTLRDAGTRARDPRGRLRRGAGRDHRSGLAARRLEGGRVPAVPLRREAPRDVPDRRNRRKRRRLRAVSGAGRALRRRVRSRGGRLLHDPSIDPGAFALVGMGTFYGGLAHVPVSSLIMVSELAGSYDLLVPLMLAEGIAFVALRKRFLYDAQVPTFSDSPVHRPSNSLEVIGKLRVAEVLAKRTPIRTFRLGHGMSEMHSALTEATWQTTFPVVDSNEQDSRRRERGLDRSDGAS